MAGCWYIDCGKIICLAEEEDVEMAYDQANSKGAALDSNNSEVQEEEVEVDLNLLPKKERNKILKQRTRDVKKVTDSVEMEATRAIARALKETTAVVEKEAKKVERSGKSKAFTPPHFLTEISTTSPL
jgi:septal ring factor EnvC (AmiA/AmiB activator)